MEEPQANPAGPSRLRRMLPWLVAMVVFDLIAAAVLIGWLGSSTARELDLHTGRARTVRYIAWLPLKERIEPTALSKALTEADHRDARVLWRALPGAETEIDTLVLTWKCARFHPEARRLMAKDVLALWESGGAVEASRPFTAKIEALIEAAGEREITAKDILDTWRAAEAGRRTR